MGDLTAMRIAIGDAGKEKEGWRISPETFTIVVETLVKAGKQDDAVRYLEAGRGRDCCLSECALDFMDSTQKQQPGFGVLLKQGAEGRVFVSTFVGRKCVIKERFSKKYRHPLLDSKLTLKRLNAEARCMTKARKLSVPTPVLYAMDPLLHTLTFEYVDGLSVKDILLGFGSNTVNEEMLNDITTQIGNAVGKLHDGGLVHGDLTTSNMIIKNSTNQLILIDFGLSFISTIPEDKAVDLYVLERALISMHSSCGDVEKKVAFLASLVAQPLLFDHYYAIGGIMLWANTFVKSTSFAFGNLGIFCMDNNKSPFCDELDGEDSHSVQKSFKTMVLHYEQVSSSEATGQKENNDRIKPDLDF
ncbi:hypothetical protein ABZP36_028871 [Zizania latifolia]